MKSKFLAAVFSLFLTSVAHSGGWQHTQKVDGFTDEVTTLVHPSENMLREALVMGYDFMIPIIACSDNGVAFAINHRYLGGEEFDLVRVDLRVDKQPPYSGSWDLLSGQKVSASDSEGAQRIISSMLDGREVLIRITGPDNIQKITATFNLAGFKNAYSNLPCQAQFSE